MHDTMTPHDHHDHSHVHDHNDVPPVMPVAGAAAPAARNTALYTPIAIVLAGVLVGGGLYFGLAAQGSGAQYAGGGQQKLNTTKKDIQAAINTKRTPAVIDTANMKAGEPRFIGKENAPLTMTYWFDYQCPFCKQFEETVLPTLIDQYVNTGKLKIVFKDYPFLGQHSVIAAEYSHAVWELYPDKFFLWQSYMFDAQDAEGDQGFGDAKTIEILTGLIPGIDVGKVHAAVAANATKYDAAATADQQDGQKNGVQGTPGFKVGTKMIDGAQALNVFQQAIDSQLK